jgi:hypothetical protein
MLTSIVSCKQIAYCDATQEFYLTFRSLDDFPFEARSEVTFDDEISALKNAKNTNFFRARLLSTCQHEFQISTKNVRYLCIIVLVSMCVSVYCFVRFAGHCVTRLCFLIILCCVVLLCFVLFCYVPNRRVCMESWRPR